MTPPVLSAALLPKTFARIATIRHSIARFAMASPCARQMSQMSRALKAVGESKAGSSYPASLAQGECVHIMTGAPVPAGADAVVMVEYTKAEGDWITVERSARAGDHIVRAGNEARANQIVIPRGTRIGYAELSVAAQVGAAKLPVFTRPRVAVLATGDELVPADEKPGAYAIRNSNSSSLAAQVALSGAEPVILGPAPDRERELRELIERGLRRMR